VVFDSGLGEGFLTENCPASLCGVEVGLDDFFDFGAVSSGKHPGDWDFFGFGEFKNHAVAHFQVLVSEFERGVGIVAQRVGTGLVEEEVRFSVFDKLGQMPLHRSAQDFTVATARWNQGRDR